MPRANKINPYLEKELRRTLQQTLADIKKPEEIEKFLTAFLSPSEQNALAKRVAVAYWLDKGRGYNNIRQNLKVSSATIAQIQSRLTSKGVQLALQKIKAEEWADRWAKKIKKFAKLR
jgi:uncharacterized protein YerC